MASEVRSLTILRLVVDAYVATAMPVSSATLKRRYARTLSLSSATLRAEMSRLEKAGLLYQPHTSAGRIPTEQGLRVYLDHLPEGRPTTRERSQLDEAAAQPTDSHARIAALAARLVGLSGHAVAVAIPAFDVPIRALGLVRCAPGVFAVFLTGRDGSVRQNLIRVGFDLSPEKCQRIENYLNSLLANQDLHTVRSIIERELAQAQAEWQQQAIEISYRALPSADANITICGVSCLAEQPEFADVDMLRALFRAVEEKRAIMELLSSVINTPGVQVTLGSEHEVQAVAGLSCVQSTWVSPEGYRATIGLLGPARMNYPRLLPLVRYASSLIGTALDQSTRN